MKENSTLNILCLEDIKQNGHFIPLTQLIKCTKFHREPRPGVSCPGS